jgi:hypothetical protein
MTLNPLWKAKLWTVVMRSLTGPACTHSFHDKHGPGWCHNAIFAKEFFADVDRKAAIEALSTRDPTHMFGLDQCNSNSEKIVVKSYCRHAAIC